MLDGFFRRPIEIRTLLARRLPGYEVRSVRGLGEGLDNAAHEVNGELIVRTSKDDGPTGAPERRLMCNYRFGNSASEFGILLTTYGPNPRRSRAAIASMPARNRSRPKAK
jgi:hypothetical protein